MGAGWPAETGGWLGKGSGCSGNSTVLPPPHPATHAAAAMASAVLQRILFTSRSVSFERCGEIVGWATPAAQCGESPSAMPPRYFISSSSVVVVIACTDPSQKANCTTPGWRLLKR